MFKNGFTVSIIIQLVMCFFDFLDAGEIKRRRDFELCNTKKVGVFIFEVYLKKWLFVMILKLKKGGSCQ
jgi:hypothetical protein